MPEPFKVEYYALVEDETYLEQKVHDFYRSQRPNMNREFFTIDCAEAINTIRNLAEYDAQIKYEEVFYTSEEEIEPTIKGLESEYNSHEPYQALMKEQDFLYFLGRHYHQIPLVVFGLVVLAIFCFFLSRLLT